MNTDSLIDSLAASADPVRPIKRHDGPALLGVAALLTLGIVFAVLGIQPQVRAGEPEVLTLVMGAMFALLGVAAGLHATRLAQPNVGGSQGGALWVFGAVMIFPAIAFLQHLLGNPMVTHNHVDLKCLTQGVAASSLAAAMLTVFVRRGAPVLPQRAGLMIGLSAGAIGALAITIECGLVTFAHLAIWHVAIVAVWAAIGRFGIARLVRW